MHINARLSTEVEIDALRIDPDFEDTEIVTTDGNREVRNVRTSQSLLRFEITYPHGLLTDERYLTVKDAYKASRGGLHSFDFQDHTEHTATDAGFGIGDGSTTAFPLYIPYTFGTETHERRIYRPVSAISLKVDGVSFPAGYSVNYTTGIVTFSVAPAADEVLSWSGEFNVPVRFSSPFSVSQPAGHLIHTETMVLQEVLL